MQGSPCISMYLSEQKSFAASVELRRIHHLRSTVRFSAAGGLCVGKGKSSTGVRREVMGGIRNGASFSLHTDPHLGIRLSVGTKVVHVEDVSQCPMIRQAESVSK